jgi:hypothetical protein
MTTPMPRPFTLPSICSFGTLLTHYDSSAYLPRDTRKSRVRNILKKTLAGQLLGKRLRVSAIEHRTRSDHKSGGTGKLIV